MSSINTVAYTDDYIESVFQIWYSAGRPAFTTLARTIPPDEHGRVPHKDHIAKWSMEGMWQLRADELTGKALAIAEENLVTQQVEMWKIQAERARQISNKAFEYIEEHGFENANTAIQALKWAQEEERKTRGAEAFITMVKDKSNDDLIKMVRDMATRQLSTEEDIVDVKASDLESIENVEEDRESAEPSN